MPVNQGSARLCLVLMLAAAACAASLRGFVQDPAGAPIPGAKASLNIAKLPEAAQTSVTDSWRVHLSGLAAGTYTLTVQAHGFVVWKRTDIRIDDHVDLQLSAVTLPINYACGGNMEQPSLPRRVLWRIERIFDRKPRNIVICQ